MGIYDYSLTVGDGSELKLEELRGRVLLIVNTATGCGFTPQYEKLEELYEKYHDKGLEIIDIPCNQFAGQAPGTDEEIHEFCTLKYNTKFPQMKKSDVNGENELPLYAFLKSQQGFSGFGASPAGLAMAGILKAADKNYKDNPDIKWNFTKFLVDREGNVVARFEPTIDMKKVAKQVAALI
ncbi:MAG: glutathione peroxidase [Oscillospiraceae bacterium]|nr:glutathione peroxidase [Oscillospiraceae bacterium]